MPASRSRFFWYELMTTDVTSAADFYHQVVGWDVAGVEQTGMADYTLFNIGERGVAGLMAMPDELKATGGLPFWIGYILVDDVDEAVKSVVAGGGAEHRPAQTIPGVGRFAVVNDPQGAVFTLMKPDGPDRQTADPMTPGLVGWHELMAIDGPSAMDFYSAQFGWTPTGAHDMGPMGSYLLFAAVGEDDHGGMMTKPPVIPSPHWNFYFSVESVKAATSRLTAAGGVVLNGPMQVPGGAWIVQARDPQEAMFCLISRAE